MTRKEALKALALYRAGRGPSGRGEHWDAVCAEVRHMTFAKLIKTYKETP
jgi:hypothetical protein